MTYRERLLKLLIKEGLAKEGYRIEQIYAGHWQRSAGAANWHVVDGNGVDVSVCGFDTMRACAERGIIFNSPERYGHDFDVFAKDKRKK